LNNRGTGKEGKIGSREGKMYPCRHWNEIRRGMREGATDVYHKSHCPPLTEFIEPPSFPVRHIQRVQREKIEKESERARESERERERDRDRERERKTESYARHSM